MLLKSISSFLFSSTLGTARRTPINPRRVACGISATTSGRTYISTAVAAQEGRLSASVRINRNAAVRKPTIYRYQRRAKQSSGCGFTCTTWNWNHYEFQFVVMCESHFFNYLSFIYWSFVLFLLKHFVLFISLTLRFCKRNLFGLSIITVSFVLRKQNLTDLYSKEIPLRNIYQNKITWMLNTKKKLNLLLGTYITAFLFGNYLKIKNGINVSI